MKTWFNHFAFLPLLVAMIGCDGSEMDEAASNGLAAGSSGSSDLSSAKALPKVTLLNVSYDPTQKLYADFNQAFAKHWKEKTGQIVAIDQSHGGSGKQSRAVIEGLQADVVSLALAGDIDSIVQKSGLLNADWQSQFPNNSSPYTSTIVFLVRKGNPKGIKDWGDLVKTGVEVITPNPKTGGGARWNYLAAWGFALKRELGDLKKLKDPAFAKEASAAQDKAKAFVADLYKHVPVLDAAARGATNTFVQRQIGDVLLTWENEAFLALKELGDAKVDIVVPSLSILAEPTVAVVTKNAAVHGTTEVAKAYLQYLYTEEGQRLAAKHYYRPRLKIDDPSQAKVNFPELALFELTDLVAGWSEAQEVHFKDRTGVFDQIYQAQ